MARYMNLIATCHVAIPLPGERAGRVLRQLCRGRTSSTSTSGRSCKSLRHHALAAGRRRHVPPPRASRHHRPAADARRSAGVSGRRRRRTSGPASSTSLLERPEYADHWANKWADLLRPNPYRVGIKAVLNFDAWIRDSFRQNKPYDQFVRELVTAQGSTWDNGAVGPVPRSPRARRDDDAGQPALPRHPAGMCQVPPSSVREMEPGRFLQLRRLLRPRRPQGHRPLAADLAAARKSSC